MSTIRITWLVITLSDLVLENEKLTGVTHCDTIHTSSTSYLHRKCVKDLLQIKKEVAKGLSRKNW